MEDCIKSLDSKNSLTISALKDILQLAVTSEYTKGSEITKKDKKEEWLCIVKEGCVTCSCIDEAQGMENTLLFFEKGDSFLPSEHGSDYSYHAASDTKILSLSFADCAHIMLCHPESASFIADLFNSLYYRTLNLCQFLRVKNPKERYRLLVEHRPKVVNALKLKTLANFLGMTPETISRVRHNIR